MKPFVFFLMLTFGSSGGNLVGLTSTSYQAQSVMAKDMRTRLVPVLTFFRARVESTQPLPDLPGDPPGNALEVSANPVERRDLLDRFSQHIETQLTQLKKMSLQASEFKQLLDELNALSQTLNQLLTDVSAPVALDSDGQPEVVITSRRGTPVANPRERNFLNPRWRLAQEHWESIENILTGY